MNKCLKLLTVFVICILIFACNNSELKVSNKSTNSEVVSKENNVETNTALDNSESNNISFDTIKTVADYDVLEMAETFESIKLGKYEQDNNKDNGEEDIEWIVLKKDGTKLLLLSKYILDKYEYYDGTGFIEWKESNLRNWLNTYFYNAAFDDEEKSFITRSAYKNYSIDVHTEIDRKDHVYEGMVTSDLVTLMGFDELIECFGRPSDNENDQFHVRKLAAKPTEFAKNIYRQYRIKLMVAQEKSWYKDCGVYWLRTKFNFDSSPYTNMVETVWYDGTFNTSQDTDLGVGVRPMILIDVANISSEKASNMLGHNKVVDKRVENKTAQEVKADTGLDGWEKEYLDFAFLQLEDEIKYYRKIYLSDNYYSNSKPLYKIDDDGSITFTYGLRDIDKDDVKELLLYNDGNLVIIFKLQRGRYENYPEYKKDYYPTLITVNRFLIDNDQNYKISLFPDNFIVKHIVEEVRDNSIDYSYLPESERAKIYNIHNHDVYYYEAVYLKDYDLEVYDEYHYYTNSEDGLGSFIVYSVNNFGKKMSLAEAQAIFNSHGSPIVLTDGTYVVK